MKRWPIAVLLAATGCGDGNPENSAACGFASIAGATMVLEQMRAGSKVLPTLPPDVAGIVPVRVAGHGTARAAAEPAGDGVVLRYEGVGFPTIPGFGLALVEDSADTFKGVLVYDLDPPYNYPQLGTVTSGQTVIPLYGLRVAWGAVSDPRCPLFGRIDTTTS